MLARLTIFVLALLFLIACSSGSDLETRDLSGDWEGLAFGESETVTLMLSISQDGSDAEATITIPTIPGLDGADGWGEVAGGGISLVLTDDSERLVFLTARVDSLGVEMTGEIAFSDSKDLLTFDIFKQ